MFQFIVTDIWRHAYPGANAGILVMRNVENPDRHPALDARKASLEQDLRNQYASMDRSGLIGIPTIQAYNTYYRTYKKTYHVQLQLESIVHKGRSIPQVAALVEAMFIAELSNLLLTAGHDLSKVYAPVSLSVAAGTESYITLQGYEKSLKTGDMHILDQEGIISSVLYGPDARTRITPQTSEVLFTVYAPAGIHEDLVRKHLEDIRENVFVVTPGAQVERLEVFSA